jgi:hypothetical protein
VNRINSVVPVRITTDFHAVKEISSDLGAPNDDVDMCGKLNWMDINLVCIFLRDSRLQLIIDDAIGGSLKVEKIFFESMSC